MRIAIGSDHAGLPLKQEIVKFLQQEGYAHHDFGTMTTDRVDYTDYAEAVATAVSRGEYDFGILVCGTANGMAMAANKVPGIRAAICHEPFSARMARLHNDANIVVLGCWIVGVGLAQEAVKAFLSTSFSGEDRHAKRLEKISDLERRCKGGC